MALASITIISSFISAENIGAQIIPQSDGNTPDPNATISDPITLDNLNILSVESQSMDSIILCLPLKCYKLFSAFTRTSDDTSRKM